MMLTDSPAFAVGMMLAGLAAGMIWYGVRLKNRRMPVSAAWIAALIGPLLALICAKAGYLLRDLGGGLLTANGMRSRRSAPKSFPLSAGAPG